MSYDENLKNLEKIVAELENGNEQNVDELRKKIAEAKKLYEECQNILRQTEEEIQAITNE